MALVLYLLAFRSSIAYSMYVWIYRDIYGYISEIFRILKPKHDQDEHPRHLSLFSLLRLLYSKFLLLHLYANTHYYFRICMSMYSEDIRFRFYMDIRTEFVVPLILQNQVYHRSLY